MEMIDLSGMEATYAVRQVPFSPTDSITFSFFVFKSSNLFFIILTMWMCWRNYTLAVCETFVKLHSNLQNQLKFSLLEQELALFSKGRKKKVRKEEEEE